MRDGVVSLVFLLAACGAGSGVGGDLAGDEDDAGKPAADGGSSARGDAGAGEAPGEDAGKPAAEDSGVEPAPSGDSRPSNEFAFGAVVDLPALSEETTIDTSACELTSGSTELSGEIQEGAGQVRACVFSVERLELTANARATGEYPLVFLVASDVVIGADGLLDLGARMWEPGAGGGAGAFPRIGPGVPGEGEGAGGVCDCNDHTADDCGGGGAGFGAPGGRGGYEEQPNCVEGGTNETVGGVAYGNEELVPLMGGSGGASAGQRPNSPHDRSSGGGGGGALQVFARGSIVIDGGILAAGGGGRYSGDGVGGDRGGGGGGSGAGVLLEAPEIGGSGLISVNGGSGASGRANRENQCRNFEDGRDGQLSMEPTPGGRKGGSQCEAGGSGGTGAVPAEPGGDSGHPGAPGGGGGAAGRVRFNWSGSEPPVAATGHISVGPLLSQGQ